MPRGATLDDVIDEVVRLRVKPNVFLYALEASRYFFVAALPLLFFSMLVAHFRTGVPIGSGLMLQVALSIYALLSFIFFVLMVFMARHVEFIITNKRVIVRASLLRRVKDNISIPIGSIKRIEVRSYNARYGSVYFDDDEAAPLADLRRYDDSRSQILDPSRPPSFDPAADRTRRLATLDVRSDWASIWLSMPSSSSRSGFYGFEHFDTFAKLVAELQQTAA
jgi:hypothetical protein